MKEKKEKTLQQMISTSENSQQHVPKHSPFKKNSKMSTRLLCAEDLLLSVNC